MSENNEINVDELLKRIIEEEEYVKSQSLSYDEFLPEFFARAEEDLAIIESCAIEIENDSSNMDAINSMFRSFHNIKGSSGFVAQENIQNIAHQTETLLDSCRKSLLKADKNIVDLILKSADMIKQVCENVEINIDEEFLEQVYLHVQKLEEANTPNTQLDKEAQDNLSPEIKCLQEDEECTEAMDSLKKEIVGYFEKAEKNLNILKNSPERKDILAGLFRVFHSIRGLSGFTGHKVPNRIAYEVEKLLNKKIINKESIETLSNSVNIIKDYCSNNSLTKDEAFLEKINENIQQINYQIKLEEMKISEEVQKNVFFDDFVVETSEHLQKIEINVLELEKDESNPDIINSILRSFHAIKGLSGFAEQQLVENISHQTESLLQSCREKVIQADETTVNSVLSSVDYIKQICNDVKLLKQEEFLGQISTHLQKMDNLVNHGNTKLIKDLQETDTKKIGEILVEQNVMTSQEVEEVIQKQKTEHPDMKFGQIAVKENKVQASEVVNALKTQQQKTAIESYMRIATGKVDSLVDMVGELVINQSLIEQYIATEMNSDSNFSKNFNRMMRITKDLQNLAMFLRLVPLKSNFQKITRIARDTINELDKPIDFSVSGEDTEIDRVVTEKLLDPLVHLVKNAISHGIESIDERLKANKDPKGSIKVHAYNKRGSIYIEVTDDGGGINTDKVYKKALEKGLIDSNKDYNEKEIQEFIMLPGFSTVEIANNISGRGVGMDVVKTEIQNIGGKVEIESVVGKGTKFTLKIPLNHAIMNGLIVDIEGSKYILPTVNVKQIVQPKEEQWIYTQGIRTQIRVREDIIPLINMKKFFGEQSKEEPILIVIIEMDQKYIALPVRNVLNRQEVVIKPVSEEFSHLDFVSGMSILGDGKVSLILDIESMFIKGIQLSR